MSDTHTSQERDGFAFAPRGSVEEIEHGPVLAPRLDANGLLTAVVTDASTGAVLMLAHMDGEALRLTIETGTAHFYSRSRGRLWRKGEESGNTLSVLEMRVDCDQDALWLRVRVEGAGVACHTGARSCFYRRVVMDPGDVVTARLEPAAIALVVGG